MKQTRIIFLLLFISGHSLATDTYVLHTGLPQPDSPEVIYTFQGKMNEDFDIKGSVSHKVIGSGIFEGNRATAIKSKMSWRSEAAAFYIETYETKYASCDSQGCKYYGSSSSPLVYQKPHQVFNIPYSAKVGDTGLVGIYVNEDDSVDNCAWSLEHGTGGLANLKLSCASMINNQITDVDNTVITIDNAGNCKSIVNEYLEEDEEGTLSIIGSTACTPDKSFLRFM